MPQSPSLPSVPTQRRAGIVISLPLDYCFSCGTEIFLSTYDFNKSGKTEEKGAVSSKRKMNGRAHIATEVSKLTPVDISNP